MGGGDSNCGKDWQRGVLTGKDSSGFVARVVEGLTMRRIGGGCPYW